MFDSIMELFDSFMSGDKPAGASAAEPNFSDMLDTYSGKGERKPVDVDGDGLSDGYAIDLDGDGKTDFFEFDFDHDGIVDAIGFDTTGDGTADKIFCDFDHDGHVDAVGADTTGDGLFDTFSFGTGAPLLQEAGFASVRDAWQFCADRFAVMAELSPERALNDLGLKKGEIEWANRNLAGERVSPGKKGKTVSFGASYYRPNIGCSGYMTMIQGNGPFKCKCGSCMPRSGTVVYNK